MDEGEGEIAFKYGVPDDIVRSYECSKDNPTMYSGGIWERTSFMEVFRHPLPLFQLQMGSLLLLQLSLIFFVKRLKMPAILIQGTVGLVLGYMVRGNEDLLDLLMPIEAENTIIALTSIGFVVYMFLIGVRMDPTLVKNSGKLAWMIGISVFAIPKLVVWIFTNYIMRLHWPNQKIPYSTFNSLCNSQTSLMFPVIVTILDDLEILNSTLGRLSLSSSLICFLLNMIFYAIDGVKEFWQIYSYRVAFKAVVLLGCFTIACVGVIRPTMRFIIKCTPEGKLLKEFYTTLIIGLALVIAIFSEFMGLEYRYLPFIVGLVVPDGPPVGSTLDLKHSALIYGKMMPTMMVFAGYKAQLSTLKDDNHFGPLLVVILLAFIFKVVAVVPFGLINKMPYKDTFALAFILSAQGLADVAIFLTIRLKEVLDPAPYTLVVIFALANATVVQFIVSLLYDPSQKYGSYRKRTIADIEKHDELRVVACVHRQDDALAEIKVLEASNPTEEFPITVYALHLIELVGLATPLLIDHQLGQKTSFTSQSRNVVHICNYFQHRHPVDSLDVQVFTAVSPYKFMQEDICSLAFDKFASLIILPFHKKWDNKGRVTLDDIKLRTINRHVLRSVPCSVGILVDRHKGLAVAPSSSIYKVAVLFLGGEDDREALAIGKRMATCQGVRVTVVHLIPLLQDSHFVSNRWDGMLDEEVLKEVKLETSEINNLVYKEELVRDSTGTASVIMSMESKFELMIIGRRHEEDSPLIKGLAEWTEFPELGPIGDLIASSDIQTAVSAFVVQA